MARAIIVGVDDSETAARAARAAADLAVSTDRVLHVVTAYAQDDHEVIELGSDRFVLSSFDEAAALARSVSQSLQRPGLEIESHAAFGKPHDVLIDLAKDVGAEVIVVGNRRMQGAGRILGSVASSIAHHAPCDVYIVKTT